MAVNDLTFNQLATVLGSITQQATGKSAIGAIDASNFVSVAQATLKTGYDPVLGAISQVVGKTIFSTRPYSRKFAGLKVSNQRYGAITRKLQVADKAFEDDDRMSLTDGGSVDQYRVNKPDVLETRYYGANVYQKSLTIFRDQLDCAFTGPDQFAEFLTMITGNASDMIEQAHENTARATLANFIAGKCEYDTRNVIHLLTEYNTATGLSLTGTTVYKPENFKPFMQWVYSRIAALSSLMEERSLLYHMNVTHFGGTYNSGTGAYTGGVDKSIMRHTPAMRQKVYLYAPSKFAVEASVLADAYHDNYLSLADTETVNFWQSIQTPDSIQVTPVCINPLGSNISPNSAVSKSKIFGVIFDEDALGYTSVNEWTASSPFNARGGYSNMYWHFTDKYWNDFTENGLVLLLD